MNFIAFLWTAQGKDGLKWVGLNTFEFLSQILKFSLKYETKVIKEKWGQYFANNHFCTPLCSKKMAV